MSTTLPDLHGLALVPVQDDWLAAGVTDIGLAAEDAPDC